MQSIRALSDPLFAVKFQQPALAENHLAAAMAPPHDPRAQGRVFGGCAGDAMKQADIISTLSGLSPDYATTPLTPLAALASELGIARLDAKNEGQRALRSFKSLGGTYAGLRALARHSGCGIAELLSRNASAARLPDLLCASDGNHGLAVAAAARHAGSGARVFLHAHVPENRERRIREMGAEIVRIAGTYDDAVDAALAAARAGEGILVADTTGEENDPVVADVMAGYGVIAFEAKRQYAGQGIAPPTHLFIQAGVGGLAAAMAEGLHEWMAPPARIVVVEPENVPCVRAGLAEGRAIRLPGELDTVAEMLSCGEASTPALRMLMASGALAMIVDEEALHMAVRRLATTDTATGGLATTASGATGLAGLIAAAADPQEAARLELDASSRVMIVISEAALED